MTTLLIGGAGQLGTALRAVWAEPLVVPSHEEFDIATGDADGLIASVRPDVLINCAAFHNVEACERDPAAAFSVNAVAVERLAAACTRRDVTLVTISSDYVFAGTAEMPYAEGDLAQPRTVYGASKLAGEVLVRRHGGRHLIVRTSAIYGTTGSSNKGITLIDKVLAQAERGDPTKMVADIVFSPSYAPHVARAIADLVTRRAYGTHHVTNAGGCSWYEFVRAAFAKSDLAGATIEPVSYSSFNNPTPRPMYSPLRNTTFAAAGIAAMPSWEDGLDEFIAARRIARENQK